MASLGETPPDVKPGDPVTANGWNQLVDQVRSLSGFGDGQDMMATGMGMFRRTKKPKRVKSCPLVHEFYIDGNPTSGSQIWSYTIDEDTQDVDFAYDDTATDVKNEFLGAFSGLDTDDLTVTGGPFPNVAIYVQFKGGIDVTWPPVQGTTTLNSSSACKIRKSGGPSA